MGVKQGFPRAPWGVCSGDGREWLVQKDFEGKAKRTGCEAARKERNLYDRAPWING